MKKLYKCREVAKYSALYGIEFVSYENDDLVEILEDDIKIDFILKKYNLVDYRELEKEVLEKNKIEVYNYYLMDHDEAIDVGYMILED